ncbi:MAG: hypothetical protein LBH91_01975 [Prevotellaceae bacterium]|nr:hypothetical protein [Prevotellaceae bacterium]
MKWIFSVKGETACPYSLFLFPVREIALTKRTGALVGIFSSKREENNDICP